MLTQDQKHRYREPTRGSGQSAIGWGGNTAELWDRINQIQKAYEEGHEIGSHGNGHFPGGSTWSLQAWQSEFRQFHEFIYGIFWLNGLKASQDQIQRWFDILNDSLLGYRAPFLEVNQHTYEVLKHSEIPVLNETYPKRYLYDASKVADTRFWPRKDQRGLWIFPLALIKTAKGQKRTLSMDYNFYVTHSQGQPQPHKAQEFEEDMYLTYKLWFEENYRSHRAPMSIGHHFSLWNDGAYFRALYRFLKDVCRLPEVRCVTYRELIRWLSQNSKVTSLMQKKGVLWQTLSTPQEGKLYEPDELRKLFPHESALWGDRPEAHHEID